MAEPCRLSDPALSLLHDLCGRSLADLNRGIRLDDSAERRELRCAGLINKRRANAGHNHWLWQPTAAGYELAEKGG